MSKIILVLFLFFNCLSGVAQITYYVDAARPDNSGAGTSWATAKRDLQAAITIAWVNDSIWVKAGIYLPTHDPFGNASPSNSRDKSFLLKDGVKIYGGFAGTETQLQQRDWVANLTQLSGDLGVGNILTDNAYHVVMSVNLSTATLLDGFTITKGYGTAPWLSSITVGTRVIDRFKGAGIYNAYSSTGFSNCIVKGNSADCTDTNDDAWGAGMVNYECSSEITDCIFDGNSFLNGGASFGVFGAGMNILGGACVLFRCYFVNNTSGSGFLDASRGGGLYIYQGATSLSNCVFYNNSAQNGACIAFGGAQNDFSTVNNCTFANNTSSFAGTSFSGFADAVFNNCILWNNTPGSSVPGRNEILSEETRVQYQPTFNNCIIRDAIGSPLAVTNAITNSILYGNPLFVNLADGDGTDNKWGTSDDGLRLQCGSAAIGAGTGVTPSTDILELTRTTIIDIGAYEGDHANVAVNPLPSIATTVMLTLNPTGVTNFSTCTNQVAAVQTGSPYTVSGSVTAKVWIEPSQASNYVKRHYELTPQLNAGTATGRVTLYFRQQDFNDFNAVNAVKLPTGPADASGIANIQIEKRTGISSNGTGLPGTYPGSIQTINNASLTKAWNAGAARWEISFDVSGFSGFFVKTQMTILPQRLLSFSGSRDATCNILQWKTDNEEKVKVFVIEKSVDASHFTTIGTNNAAGAGTNWYIYRDCSVNPNTTYYRLKLADMDGGISYSPVIVITKIGMPFVELSPNPARDNVRINFSDETLLHTLVKVTDASGRLVIQQFITNRPHSLDIASLLPGFYMLHFSNGSSLKFLKTND